MLKFALEIGAISDELVLGSVIRKGLTIREKTKNGPNYW
jgi:hypothetical protein